MNRFVVYLFATTLFTVGCTQIPTASKDILIPIDSIKPPILLEVRYATDHNFTGKAVYDRPKLWLHRDTAKALEKVQHDLKKSGLGLKVYDAYRPLSVQQHMWNLIRDERYVSNPAKNKGRHTRGTAVDVTLIDSKGCELSMPSDFDEFTERSHRNYQGGTPVQRAHRKLLEDVMVRHGFLPFPDEWWHFDLNHWENYPVHDVSLKTLDHSNSNDVIMMSSSR